MKVGINIRVLCLAFAVIAYSCVALASEASLRFFSNMPDLPIMQGLEELQEQSISFDKPEGRISESLAVMGALEADDILSFYARTLPQLGWIQLDRYRYIRDGEHLRFSFEAHEGEKFFRVSISPS